MAKIVELDALTFKYPSAAKNALDGISLCIEQGAFVTLCGVSGCGKSTLLRCLKPSIRPFGEMSGTVLFEGKPIDGLDRRRESAEIGFVAQNPDNAIVTDKVRHELVFSLESLGTPNAEMRRKAAEISAFFGIDEWFHKSVSELSGGQKQLLCLAAVMISEPKLLILDEPTAQLDPIAAQSFISALRRVNKELGTTVIISEHRLEEVLPISDSVIVMDKGEIKAQGSVADCARALSGFGMLRAMPSPMRIYAAVDGSGAVTAKSGTVPLTVSEGRAWLQERGEKQPFLPIKPDKGREISEESVITLKDVWFRYDKNGADVLKGVNLEIKQGEIFAILGGNGTGKTTALSVISGANRPYKGRVKTAEGKRVVSLPQNPQLLFEHESVEDELTRMGADEELVKSVAKFCKLGEHYEKHPYDLSGGEAQRLALAKVLLTEPDIILLDEPSKGMDAEFKHGLSKMLKRLTQQGITVVMVSHDVELCMETADECALFFDGEALSAARTREFFRGNSFYASAAQRMAKGIIDNALSVKDVIAACGGVEESDDTDDNDGIELKRRGKAEEEPKPKKESILKRLFRNSEVKIAPVKQSRPKLLLFLPIIIALTVLTGFFLGGDRRFYALSLAVIAETLAAFLASFEKRAPQTREIVALSVMSALAVAGRTAFYMLPQIKPMGAVVMLAGAAFGAQSGFFVGAVAAFVSSFFFGQGPWTPWQMLAFGMLGFAAGLIFRRARFRRFGVALTGAVLTLVVYGGIMNLSSLLLYQSTITREMLVSTYALGLPFDAVHAAGTGVFLFVGAVPVMRKLERVKRKYGMCSEE